MKDSGATRAEGPTRPSVYEYGNYRKFLRDTFDYLKGQSGLRRFTIKQLADRAGFRSHSALVMVMNGKRGLSSSSVPRIAHALELKKGEADFFANLVFLNQSKTPQERQFYSQQLIKSKQYRRIHPMTQASLRALANWYFLPIREMISTDCFQEDPRWIAKKLKPAISEAEAKRALKDLETLGMTKRDQNGKLVLTSQIIGTEDQLSSHYIPEFHRNMIQRSLESVDRFDKTDRNLAAVTLAVSEEKFREIEEMMHRFRKEVTALAEDEQDSERVFQLNLQLFPVTE